MLGASRRGMASGSGLVSLVAILTGRLSVHNCFDVHQLSKHPPILPKQSSSFDCEARYA